MHYIHICSVLDITAVIYKRHKIICGAIQKKNFLMQNVLRDSNKFRKECYYTKYIHFVLINNGHTN